jgi:hypothetical protein
MDRQPRRGTVARRTVFAESGEQRRQHVVVDLRGEERGGLSVAVISAMRVFPLVSVRRSSPPV